MGLARESLPLWKATGIPNIVHSPSRRESAVKSPRPLVGQRRNMLIVDVYSAQKSKMNG